MQPWNRLWVRWSVAIATGLVAFGICNLTPIVWDSAILISWDIAILTWLILVYFKVRKSDARATYLQSQSLEPIGVYVLGVVVTTATAGLLSAVALASHNPADTPLGQQFHFAAGVLAIVLAWVFLHLEFSLYYARLYYDELDDDAGEANHASDRVVPFRKGLEFPEGDEVDYWAFIFYAFSVGMSYQGPGVAAVSGTMRRVTLLHALISFFFTLIILGYTVNAIGQLI